MGYAPHGGQQKYVRLSDVICLGLMNPHADGVENGTRPLPLHLLSYRRLLIAIGQSTFLKNLFEIIITARSPPVLTQSKHPPGDGNRASCVVDEIGSSRTNASVFSLSPRRYRNGSRRFPRTSPSAKIAR